MSDADKPELRELLLARRRALSAAERRSFSESIQSTLLDLLQERGIRHVLVYRAMGDEVATDMILASGAAWQLYAPHTPHADHMEWLRIGPETGWQRGRFGVMEPQQGELWDAGMRPAALICPMTGFDRRGHRLGMGLGCFDRWLGEHHAALECIIGLAYACQEWPALPEEAHDIPMHMILTEREAITCPTP
ncbi:MAG TPA: 5-formyltetrahydrofolate cyclo-ligase [Mariprofundaceae bacterium]|nr:5-formyltetrahydrofolate cyclo-ligase [Mariprofundaceae bacterium]